MTYGNLKKKYNISRSTIQYIILSDNKCKKKNGRKEAISKYDKRKILSMLDYSNANKIKLSSLDIIRELKLTASRSTVCRVLRYIGCKYDDVRSKFKINFHQKRKRVEMAKAMIISNIQWKQVVFTDEKYFTLNGSDSYYCWIRGNKSPYGIKKVLRAPGLMVWGMVMSNGLLSYEIMKGKQNSKKYIDIIKNKAVPIIKLNLRGHWIFQQDNCPIHVSREAQNYFKNENIDCLKWPPYSPDINIIENIWACLTTMIYKEGNIKNLTDLRFKIDMVVTIFNETQVQYVQRLYESVPSRLCDIIIKRGDRLKY